MNALDIVLAQSALSPVISIVDLAVLRCVCKEVNCILTKNNLNDNSQTILVATAEHLECIKSDDLFQDNCLNVPLLFQFMCRIKRYYGDTKKTKQLVDCLNIISSQLSYKILKLNNKTELDKLINTMQILFDISHKTCKTHNMITTYIMMNFIKRMAYISLPKKSNEICKNARFRRSLNIKCQVQIREIREEITYFPFGFLEKVIRQCTEARRWVSYYEPL